MKCRHCADTLELTLIDLGSAPPSNSYLTLAQLRMPERWYPLRILVCTRCWLVQTEDYADASELFTSDYAYFSSFSDSWLSHAERYVADMTQRFELDGQSQVVEVAANDGYLLQFVQRRGIPCLGIEPTRDTAAAARAKGIEIEEAFFGIELADRLTARGRQADLIAANNVLAHVPDINGFVAGFARLLKPSGVATFEFPHLLQLIGLCQFDTIYHEHFSYLSLTTVKRVFEANGLSVFDVEELPTHGGSLRVFAQRSDTGPRAATGRIEALLAREAEAGVSSRAFYAGFQARAEHVKNSLLAFLIGAKEERHSIAAYGAAAKGNTLINFAGIRSDLLPYVVDRNPAKQDRFLPGSRIPVLGEEVLRARQPRYILILPWNLRDEVSQQLAYARVGSSIRHGDPVAVADVKIAVSGGSGFLGRHLVRALLIGGVQVIATSRSGIPPPGLEAAHWIALDLEAPTERTCEALIATDALVHLAWEGLPNYSSLDHFERELPRQYAFLSGLVRAGLPRLLVAGTCLEYGMQCGELSEIAVTDPTTAYSIAKDALRRALEALRGTVGFQLTWARLFYMYGPGQSDASLFSQWTAARLSGASSFPMSAGEQLRDFLPVERVAELLRVLAVRQTGAGVVNVCSGRPLSVRSLVESWNMEAPTSVRLEFGARPYASYEPLAFWGSHQKLDALLAGQDQTGS